MRGGNLTLAIALVGVGGLLVWVGFSDPAGGLFGVVANALRGKSTPAATSGSPSRAAAAASSSTSATSAPASTSVPVPGTRVRAQ